jgi:hypothetical protein
MSLIAEGNFWVWVVLTVILGGGASFLAGRAIAGGWQPIGRVIASMIPMGIAIRFLHFALFGGQLTSLHYLIVDTLVMIGAALLGYQMTKASKMVSQYPWLYEKAGPLGWKSKT